MAMPTSKPMSGWSGSGMGGGRPYVGLGFFLPLQQEMGGGVMGADGGAEEEEEEEEDSMGLDFLRIGVEQEQRPVDLQPQEEDEGAEARLSGL